MMKFDPFSFSGAPLGGWGRATRSRLATLPLRLVVGNDGSGGFPLLYGESGGGSSDGERRTGASPAKTSDDDIIVPTPDNESENDGNEKRKLDDGTASSSSSSSSSFNASIKHDATGGVQRSTGPHFTIHDVTGQQYVCRAYAEDELIVRSRIDSVFNPAITIWDHIAHDDVEHEMGENRVGDDGDGPAKDSVDNGKEGTKKPRQNSFHFTIKGGLFGVDDAGNLPETIRTSVAKLLRKLRMHDAADELLGMDIDLNGEGVVLMVDDNIEGGDDERGMASEIANIIKAAALGAGMGSSITISKGDQVMHHHPQLQCHLNQPPIKSYNSSKVLREHAHNSTMVDGGPMSCATCSSSVNSTSTYRTTPLVCPSMKFVT